MSGKWVLGGMMIAVVVIAGSALSLVISNATERSASGLSGRVPTRTRADTAIKRVGGGGGDDEPDKMTFLNNHIPGDLSLVECTISTPPLSAQPGEADDNAGANGILQITVRNDLSPIASKVFLDLVNAHHFDGVFIFRVLKGFVAQWGVRTAGDDVPGITKPPKTKDDVHDKTLSNVRGTLSFAGGNPATQQVFVNLGNNQRLDKENSRPFATVQGMQLLDQLYTGYKDGQGQIKALQKGEAAMREAFPRMSRVNVCRVVPAFSTG